MVSLVLCCDKIIVSERHHFQVLAAQALDRFEDWNVVQMVSISKSITNIVSHHHNVLQICDFILPSKRGLELKQVFALLAASTIQREGHEFFKYIILPLGPGEVMKLLSDYHLDEESDYYIANSFLLLLEQSLPTDHITAHQKRGLKNVVDKLRSLNAEVKEGGGRFLDRTKPAEFHWNSHTQANVVGSFYYGYWVLQVPGAWIALKMGATRIFGYGVLLASLMSILTPVATRYHVMGLVCVRVVQGVFLGVTFPCVIAIWARWAPPLERSTMVTMAIAGSPVGNIIAIPLTGILAKYGFDGGWPSVFYFFGFLGLLWYGLWEYIVYDSPDSHPSITDKEKRYINKTIGEKPFDPLKETLPLCAIFTSVPMWGIIIGHFGACWGYYTLFTQMPTYLKDIQHLDIKTMGMVAATPYILKAFLGPVGGISADMILKYNYLSVRGVRVLFYALGCISAGFFIMMTGYFVRKGEAIAFLILGVGFSGLNATGYAVNHLDLAPRYAGVLMGVTNTFATMPGFLSPLLTGYIASNKKASEWRTVFWITFIVYIVCTGLYSIMCSGEKQWWAEGAKVKPTPESETGMVDKSTETEDSVSVAIDDIESQSAEDSMQNKKDKTD